MTHLLKQFIGQEIVHQTLVAVRIEQPPVRIGWHSQKRHLSVAAEFVLNFHDVRLFGKAGGDLSKNLEICQPLKLRRGAHGAVSTLRVDYRQPSFASRCSRSDTVQRHVRYSIENDQR